jgi:hypothetical protein
MTKERDNMANTVRLRLDLKDVYGKALGEKTDIILRNQGLSQVKRVSANASTIIEIAGLFGAPQGLYRMEIDPPSYQCVSQFVNLKASGTTSIGLTLPIDPRKVKRLRFPSFSSLNPDLRRLLESSERVLSFLGNKGKALYDSLDDIRRAGLLNIAVKTGATTLTNERTVLSYIDELQEVRGDRFFVRVSKELREETKNCVAEGLFYQADSSLHHPPPGFSHAGSFKTSDHYGNLQLTFFTKEDNWVADVDIDDAGGIEHVFQVLRNRLSGQPTHPYNIHEILVGYLKLDPGYELVD